MPAQRQIIQNKYFRPQNSTVKLFTLPRHRYSLKSIILDAIKDEFLHFREIQRSMISMRWQRPSPKGPDSRNGARQGPLRCARSIIGNT